MTINLHKTIVLSGLLAFSSLVFGQTVTTPATPTQAVQNLLGTATTPVNVQYLGNAQQLATFTTSGNNLPISSGVVMSTGNATNAMLNGPSSNFLSGTAGGVTGNPLLNAISGVNTYDGAILQFDFVPVGDTMKFNYVFASEEYNDYTNSTVNDAFGFFLSGPNPLGGNYVDFNVALIPGTNIPVSINTVNNGYSSGCSSGPCEYCQYFIDNICTPSNIAPDAFTTLLTAIAPVVPCATYTIKLGIADGGDSAFDSWVFLQENSFSTGAVTISPNYNYTSANNDTLIYEGCSDVTLDFLKDGVSGTYDTISVVISGTATNGVDYTSNGGLIPNQIVFAPGQTSIQLPLTPIADQITEGNETVTLTVTNITACGDTLVSSVTILITDVQPMDIDAGPDRLICPGVAQTFTPAITGGVPPYQQTYWFFNTPANILGTALNNYVPQNSGMYIYTATNGCNPAEIVFDTVMVTIGPPQFSLSFEVDSVSCFGSGDGAINLTVAGQTPPFSYQWTPGNITTEDLSDLDAGTYGVTVTDAFGCQLDSTLTVFEPANIPINLGDKFVCSNAMTTINPNPTAGVSYSWAPANYFNDPNASSPVFTGSAPGPGMDTVLVTVVGTSPGACGQDDFKVYITPQPVVSLYNPGFDTTALCPNDTLFLENDGDNTGYPAVTSYAWSNGQNTPMISATTPGTYWLELTNTAGCKYRDSLQIVPLSPPNAYIDSIRYICGTQVIPLYAVSYNPNDTLIWSTGEITDTILVSTSGTYSLILSNTCGSDTVSTQVVQIPTVEPSAMPNIFTPNGDGVNDIYNTQTLFEYSQKFNVKVFNRWGAKVFETEDKSINWSPKNLSDGVYFMSIIYTDCNNELKKLAHSITIISK